MKTQHEYWTIENLQENIDKIEFPEFQREPTVWNLDKKRRLIDSILRDFDISSIYFYQNESGGFDCIDGRQRINAILSYLGINEADKEDNEFHLEIHNEIFDDEGYFEEADRRRFRNLEPHWQQKILNYKLNIVFIKDVEKDEELNLLFLRLQIASVLNAGEKLHAMTGDIRDWIFLELKNHTFFERIKIPNRRYTKEQVATQIILNVYSLNETESFRRSRYVDMQEFFKEHTRFDDEDEKLKLKIKRTLDILSERFGNKLTYINNRALAVSTYLFVNHLIEDQREEDIADFVEFLVMLLKTLKWQVPKSVHMHEAYYDLLRFQTNITQAAPEKYAIERRHSFLREYFYHFRKEENIKGDAAYMEETSKDPNKEREGINL